MFLICVVRYLSSLYARLEITIDSRPELLAVPDHVTCACTTRAGTRLVDGLEHARGDGSAAVYGKRKGAIQYLTSVLW